LYCTKRSAYAAQLCKLRQIFRHLTPSQGIHPLQLSSPSSSHEELRAKDAGHTPIHPRMLTPLVSTLLLTSRASSSLPPLPLRALPPPHGNPRLLSSPLRRPSHEEWPWLPLISLAHTVLPRSFPPLPCPPATQHPPCRPSSRRVQQVCMGNPCLLCQRCSLPPTRSAVLIHSRYSTGSTCIPQSPLSVKPFRPPASTPLPPCDPRTWLAARSRPRLPILFPTSSSSSHPSPLRTPATGKSPPTASQCTRIDRTLLSASHFLPSVCSPSRISCRYISIY